MAGSVEHLTVAWEIRKIWRKRGIILQTPELFLAGNVCPDGIHERKPYTRPLKMHTHFRDDIPDWEFSKPENLELFHKRIHAFAGEVKKHSEWNRELYMGYITHILTDEQFMLKIRPYFMNQVAVLGLTQKDKETFVHFSYDVNQVDWRLGKEYEDCRKIYHCFSQAANYEIEGMVTARELSASKEWILRFFYDEAPEPKQPRFLDYPQIVRFVQETAEIVAETAFSYLEL